MSTSPCAACKLLRRKCTPECIFAPYFPSDQPTKFANVHRVFGASNIAKLLKELSPEQREDAVVSLAYEAEARLRDPVHGCVGYIYLLQHKLREVQHDLSNAKKELAVYVGPVAFGPFLPHLQPQAVSPHQPHQYHQQLQGASPGSVTPFGVDGPGIGMGPVLVSPATPPQGQMVMNEQQQIQQMAEMQQTAVAVPVAAREQEEMLSGFSQYQGFDGMAGGGATLAVAAGMSSRVASVPGELFNCPIAIEQQPLQQQYVEQPRGGSRSEERSGIGPSCRRK